MSINIFEFNVRRFDKTPFGFYDLLLLTDDRIEEGVADVKPIPMKDVGFNDDFKKKPQMRRGDRYGGYRAVARFSIPVTKEPNSPVDTFKLTIDSDARRASIEFTQGRLGYQSRSASDPNRRSADFSNRLFATIVALVKKFIKIHKPPTLYFSSSGRGRTKLYKRLTQMFAGDFEDAGSRIGRTHGSFLLRKRGSKTSTEDLLFITDVDADQKVIFLKDHRNDTPMIILPREDDKAVKDAEAKLAQLTQELEARPGYTPRRGSQGEREIEKLRLAVGKAEREVKTVARANMAAYVKAVKAVQTKKKRLQKAGDDDFIEIAEVVTAKKAIEYLVMRGLKKGTKIQLANYPGTMSFVKVFMRKGLVR